METLKGIATKIRVLKLSESPLIRFNIETTNCLIAKNSLNFLADVEEGTSLVVAGTFNAKHQFIVKKYTVIHNSVIDPNFYNTYNTNKPTK